MYLRHLHIARVCGKYVCVCMETPSPHVFNLKVPASRLQVRITLPQTFAGVLWFLAHILFRHIFIRKPENTDCLV